VELLLASSSKLKFKNGTSEIAANIIISFTFISMIITIYALGLNYTLFLYKEEKIDSMENFSLFLANGLNSMYFLNESRIFNTNTNPVIFRAGNHSTLLINDVILGSWKNFEISIYTGLQKSSGNETIILYGDNSIFSLNETSFYIALSGERIIVKFNVKIASIGNCLFIRAYTLKNKDPVVLNGRFMVRISSIHRFFHKYFVSNKILRISLIYDNFSENLAMKLSSPLILILLEIIEFEVDEL